MRLLLPLILLLGTFAGGAEGFVVVCPVNGMVDDGMRVFVERVIREASGAQAIIFEVDTPGGRIDSAIDISNAIIGTPIRTIAFIKGMGAISAGALISYSCDELIMAPEANIGTATPVMATPEGMLPTGEKEVSYMRARMRSLAERKNRNPAIAEAMVDKDIELHAYTDAQGQLQIYGVYTGSSLEPPAASDLNQPRRPGEIDPSEVVRRVFDLSLGDGRLRAQVDGRGPAGSAPVAGPRPQGEVILPTGKLLTLTAQEALHYGLIPAIANDLQGVLAQYAYSDAEVRRLDMSAGERIFRWLTNPVVAGLLLMLGIGGIYLEIKTPGFGAPGIVGIICLTLFFGSHLVIGIADFFDVILVATGLVLIAIEIFALPGFGFVGAAGILCLLVGLYTTLTTAPIPEFSWEYDRMSDAMKSLLIATLSLGLLIYATWRFLPKTAMYGRLVQTHEQLQGRGYVVQSAVEESAALGQHGVALSLLRPAGRGRFGEKTIQVVSRAEYIEPGTPIVIVQVDGNRYVVDRLEEQT
ncbi:MAG TPA: NfeD family protein [Candidatus Bathyarchaeia archaeon]|nr:NfeD family protein [Candidatus Bathyarchaeia archaeon]